LNSLRAIYKSRVRKRKKLVEPGHRVSYMASWKKRRGGEFRASPGQRRTHEGVVLGEPRVSAELGGKYLSKKKTEDGGEEKIPVPALC